MFSYLPLKEIDTLGRSLSKRVEFSGSNESNSTYSPSSTACLYLSVTCADKVKEACDESEDGREPVAGLGWWRMLATKLWFTRG